MRAFIFPLVMGLVGAAILISLGNWQLRRLAEKQEMLGQIEAMISSAAEAMPERPSEATDEYRAVHVRGEISGAPVFVLTSRKSLGPGHRVIYRLDTQAGPILIDAGFQRGRAADPGLSGAVDITGNLMWPNETDSYTPAPDTEQRLWFARDLRGLAAFLDTKEVLVVARDMDPAPEGLRAWPVSTSGIPNDHLQYAITWFSLAVVWLGMTGYWLWRIRRRTFADALESTK